MDWNSKAPPSWDLSELEQGAFPNIETVSGSSSFGDHRAQRGDFSVDLKLGQVGSSGNESVKKWKEPGVSKMASPPSGSSKRARAANNGTQPVSCLVDGCTSDLSVCRDYHRRHKVCELHSKTPQVTICGQKQRFCQQCSRFHSLDEFDEGKRSCRKRLDGHNRRRRKPQPEPLSRSGNYLSNYQVSGPQFIQFSGTHVYPSTTVMSPAWAGVLNSAADARLPNHQQQLQLLDKQKLYLGSSPSTSSYIGGGKQISFLQNGSATLNNQLSLEAPVCQPLLRTIASESDGARRKMYCDRLTARVHDSDCALSLLSSPQSQSSGLNLSHVMHPNSASLVQPLGPSLHGDRTLEPMDSVLVSNGSGNNVHCQGMFLMGSDGSQGNQTPQNLPFHNWE